METGHSDTETEGIRVRVASEYIAEQSDPKRGRWIYAYHVMIANVGDRTVRLLSRHWIIRDANNEQHEVRGPGVVGEQPHLAPDESFEYRSGCTLGTEWGTMEGTYRMQREDGEEFDARIGRFFLAPNVAPIGVLMSE